VAKKKLTYIHFEMKASAFDLKSPYLLSSLYTKSMGLKLGCVCSGIFTTFFHPRFVGWVSDAEMNSIINPDFTDSDPTIPPFGIKIG
jgi:hypothetical protein